MKTSAIYMILMATMQSKKTPTQLAILITVLSAIITIHTKTKSSSSWLGAILLLTYTGGMMILFIYTASVTKTEPSKTKSVAIPTVLITAILLSSKSEKEIPSSNPKMTFNHTIPITITILLAYSLMVITKFIENPQNTMKVTK